LSNTWDNFSNFFLVIKNIRNIFKSVVAPGCLLSSQLGCADLSCLLGIASVFEYFLHPKNCQAEKLINVFVAGAHSSSIIQMQHTGHSTFEVKPSLNSRLSARSKRSAVEFSLAVQAKKHLREYEATYDTLHDKSSATSMNLCFSEDRVAPGAYMLVSFDSQLGQRVYKRRDEAASLSYDVPLSTPLRHAEDVTLPAPTKKSNNNGIQQPASSMRNNEMVVVTGVSAGLPCVRQADGKFAREAFDPLNLDRLILGENMIDNLSEKQLAVSA
jgi:hypothetical protein